MLAPHMRRVPHALRSAPMQGHQCRRNRRLVQCLARGKGAMSELDEIEKEKATDAAGTCTELQWQSPLTLDSIEKYPSPVLRRPNQKVGIFGEPLKKLAAEMFDVMYRDDGVGLAAPQVGINLRLMVFNQTGEQGKGTEMVLANPRIMSAGKKVWSEEEACLSFIEDDGTKVTGEVQRPYVVKVKAQDADGQPINKRFEGWEARVFQHEFDHLDGVLFPDKIPQEQLQREAEKLQRLEALFEKQNPSSAYDSILSGGVMQVA